MQAQTLLLPELAAMVFCLGLFSGCWGTEGTSPLVLPESANGSLSLSSPAFAAGGAIPSKYTCDGLNISPPLEIDGIPEEAQSLALIVDDPDAPLGTWDHWLVWNIAPDTRQIAEHTAPRHASQGVNGFNRARYDGPCPPGGTHHYRFKLFALDNMLNLPAGSDKHALQAAIQGHILSQTELIGTYQRQKQTIRQIKPGGLSP